MSKELSQSERGAVVIWFAMLIVLLLALLSLAVDIGWLFVKRTQLQNTADAAALSCGSFNYRTPGSCQNGDTALSNPTVIGSVNPDNFSIVTQVPTTCPIFGQNTCVKTTATTTWTPFFLKAFDINSLTLSASSIAGTGPGSANTIPCVLGLKSTGTNVSFSASQSTSANCLIASNSTSANSIYVRSNANVSSTVGVTTSGGIDGIITAPAIKTYQSATTDPYAGLTPPIVGSCTPANTDVTFNTCSATLASGTYCGLIINPANGCSLNLSGTYVIRKGVKSQFPGITFSGANGSNIRGTEVTIYGYDGAITTSGNNGNIDLKSPVAGDLRGILYWQKPSNLSTANIAGSGGSTYALSGTFYVPNGSLILSPSGSTFTVGDLVASTITISGSTTLAYTGQGSPLYRTHTTLLK